MDTRLPAGLAQLLKSLGIDPTKAVRGDGRVTITYDGGRRLDCHLAPNARLILSAHVAAVPADLNQRRSFFRNALSFATSRLAARHDTLAMATGDDTLVLQCEVDGGVSVLELETRFAGFFDAIDTWRRTLQTMSTR